MYKTFATIGCAAALALIAPGTAVAGTAPAVSELGAVSSASGPPAGAPCSVGARVVTCYVAHGDIFWVKDKKADGYHVDAVWSLNGSGGTHCHDRLGARAGWTYCDFSKKIPEHRHLVFRGLVMDGKDDPVGNGTSGPEVQASTS
ncbi:hypothetical protein [Sciscionella sediminilitoris]|uniref:hypothetical protein n=1 Tax=Sciscionella sediminilitoris TaxID=1445613 RepID=UPI00068EE4A5|nr:hypothetical protein [Sciscionella sp. SE31]